MLYQLSSSELGTSFASQLAKNKIVVEVLETCQPTDDLLDAIRELYREGYLIALDDFTLTPEWRRFLPYVHIVKLDIMAMGLEKRVSWLKPTSPSASNITFSGTRRNRRRV